MAVPETRNKIEGLLVNPVQRSSDPSILHSPYLGTIPFEGDSVISMPEGLIGFPGLKRFLLLEHGKDMPFLWFHSIDEPHIAFMVMDPLLIRPDYRISVREREIRDIGGVRKEDLIILAIVTIKDDHPRITVNLKAPVIIDIKTRKGKQILLEEDTYPLRYPVLD